MQLQDRLLKKSTLLSASLLFSVFCGIFIVLYAQSDYSFKTFGLNFLTGTAWSPTHNQFSALTAVIGTLVTSLLAIAIATPLSLLLAAFATHLLPQKISAYFSVCLQVLAGIPSIIFGMWGLYVLTPIFAEKIEPVLTATLGKLPLIGFLFDSTPMGIGVFTAGCVLAIMITPLLSNMFINLLQKIPATLTESAYASGATRLEVFKRIQLPYLKSGILGSIILGLGRALGETMAVTFVIGNSHKLSSSLLMPGSTIASTIANEFSEATSKLYSSSLMGLALVLMAITFITLIIARYFLRRYER